ncbi:hypothetical protein [Halorhabdus sp. CUG00001]|uniref:hypothetical protein n=1 Tax=Halorhabdus sp. CUG00001 TaxID=2600297 RepID=UPI00131D3234|nr:hypothetical protein [Halorhabdus sp. CUG00001]
MTGSSRRAVLRYMGIGFGAGLTGCSGLSTDQTEPTTEPVKDTTTTAGPTTEPPEPTATTERTDTPFPCATDHELPYSIPGAAETYQSGSVEIRNQTASKTTVTLAIAHDDNTFFACSQTLTNGESLSFDGVTATAGRYTVTVSVEEGRSTTTEWRIPSEQNYPMLLVSIRGDDEPVIGCPGDREVSIQVRNVTDSSARAELTLRRDDRVVTERSVQVDPMSNTDVSLPLPIGDLYVLEVSSEEGRAEKRISACRGYEEKRITATIDSGQVELDSRRIVWE